MTRKDYILIAAALAAARAEHDKGTTHPEAFRALDRAASRLADRLAADNARFDYDRFMKAAGVQS